MILDLVQRLRDAARRYRNQPAVIAEQEVLTYSALDRSSDRLAAHLVDHGINKSDRIALYCTNGPEFVIAYVGILKAGATVVPVNILLKPAEIQFILNDSETRALLYHCVFAEAAAQIRNGVNSLSLCIELGTQNPQNLPWNNPETPPQSTPQISIEPRSDLAAILYTSGTTGKPKGAMLSHANLSANIHSILQALQWRPAEERILLVLPMFHAFAATVGVLTTLSHGCAVVPLAKFEPDRVLDRIAATSATIFLGVPSMYNVLLRINDSKVRLFKSIRYCVSGGAALPIQVKREFEAKFGTPIYEGDGPTECSPVTCVNPVGGLSKPGTVGLPIPDVEMSIVDDQGNPVPDGEVGEIAVRGPNVMRGYWKLPEATDQVMRDGWFLTGDLGTRDADGYFSIVDRKKDLVIVNGMNVYPRVVEEVLYRLEGVREAAVVGEMHTTHGEIPVAFIAVEQDFELEDSTIRRWCQEHLGRYQIPKKFYRLQELPKNAAGKILKRELQRHGEWERGIDPTRQEKPRN